jgi:hypothetical protein
VIAKLCTRDKGLRERKVYEHVLPRLPCPAVDYYGSVDAADGGSVWLFLEDVGGEPYDPDKRLHRTLAARWLGELEAHTEHDGVTAGFPDRGTAFHSECLASIVETLPEIRQRPSLQSLDVEILDRIGGACRILGGMWSEVEDFCATVPAAFAHSDCLSKNVHIRDGASGPCVAAFDWGGAGWAPVGTDLGQLALPRRGPPGDGPDYDAYRAVVAGRWPDLDTETIARLAQVGQLFWALKVISRGLPEFDRDWRDPEHVLADMHVYERALARSLVDATGLPEPVGS